VVVTLTPIHGKASKDARQNEKADASARARDLDARRLAVWPRKTLVVRDAGARIERADCHSL